MLHAVVPPCVRAKSVPIGDSPAVERLPRPPLAGDAVLLARYREAAANVEAARKRVEAARKRVEAPGAGVEATRVHEAARRALSNAARALVAAGVDRVLAARADGDGEPLRAESESRG